MSWDTLYSDVGPILLALWYNPPGNQDHVTIFEDEWRRLSHDVVGTILVGDLNLHHTSWLTYSHSNTPEGRRLHEFCRTFGFRQCVKAPTRGMYLLDLVLTDLQVEIICNVLHPIADHNVVQLSLQLPLPDPQVMIRNCWHFGNANWKGLRRRFRSVNWHEVVFDDVDASVRRLNNAILDISKLFIRYGPVSVCKGSHPWLDNECRAAIQAKQNAFNTDSYTAASSHCNAVLKEAFGKYQREVKILLADRSTSSKRWRKVSRSLLMSKKSGSSIPPLKDSGGRWLTESVDKANLFVSVFKGKSTLVAQELPLVESQIDGVDVQFMFNFAIRTRRARKLLANLREDIATGPDTIPVFILKRCACELALPVALLCRLIRPCAVWPDPWREHWIIPLLKRGSPSLPRN